MHWWYWAVAFLILAVVAAALGFAIELTAAVAQMMLWVAFIFLALFVISLAVGSFRGGRAPRAGR